MKSSGKQAVIIIHGIGNQYPMQTGREFVLSIKDKADIMFSSPDRQANYYETRRLSLNNKNTDFHELYWAHLMEEPKKNDAYTWVFNLLFCKIPSTRSKKYIHFIRWFLVSLLIVFLVLFFRDLHDSWVKTFNFMNSGIYAVVVYLFFKFGMPNIESQVVSTIGDAVNYLTASPKSIPSRYKIRKRGLQLLRSLHDKKNEHGQPFYDRIVLVSHSLGSVIAYDLLTHFWYEKMYDHQVNSPQFSQTILKEMNDYVIAYHQNKNNSSYQFDIKYFQELQQKVFEELKQNGNPWRVSDFVTLGSPLSHGGFILARSQDDFIWRRRFREFPISPPKIDVKIENNNIVKDYARGFIFKKKVKRDEHNWQNIQIISHSSMFAFVKWHNIYFENDQIGGDLSEHFGEGISNIKLQAKGHWFKRNLPIHSHTDYWDSNQTESLNHIKKIIFNENNTIK